MTLVIVIIMLVAYVLIATEHLTGINKAGIAMFAGVLGWILISDHDFTPFSNYISDIVLYLLSTICIVNVLVSYGCFDFIVPLLRVRSTTVILWGFVSITCLLSANFDNLTSAVVMLLIMRRLLANPEQRRYVGSCIALAACAGGAVTVIGDPTTLAVWGKGAVTPSAFFQALILPSLVGVIVPTLLVRQCLPEHLDLNRGSIAYRGGADIQTPLWQRLVLFTLGIGGLWFVPTFHKLTHLPSFLGALCVLAVVWLAVEIFNSTKLKSEQPSVVPAVSRLLATEVLKVVMFFIGVALGISALVETGAMYACSQWLDSNIHDVYVLSVFLGIVSSVLDNVCLVLSAVNVYPVLPPELATTEYLQLFTVNGQYWHLVVISGSLGGMFLPIGSTSGLALMKSEDVGILWYLRHISLKMLLGWVAALITYFLVDWFLR